MSNLTISERARALRLSVARAGSRGLAGVLGSPLLRWRYGAPVAEAISMVPQELRPADPSFAGELLEGQFGLAHTPADVGSGTPFDITPPNEAWARALHGFGWLSHLQAAGSEEAVARARSLVKEWIVYGHGRHDVAWEPDVTGRRLISWLSNAGILLENVDQATFDRTAGSLVDQLKALSAHWRAAPPGYPRLEALLGVVYCDFCVMGHERRLAVSERRLEQELQRQVLVDGGHISRNAAVLVELLLDLLPLRQCYATHKRALPAGIEASITRMLSMLRFMRLGDGTLARFNGVGATPIAELTAILSYYHSTAPPPAEASQSRYARLARGDLVLIADSGVAPELEHAGRSCAGALSFELSAGRHAIFVNCGTPRPAEHEHEKVARSTTSHNTPTLGTKSTARLLEDERLSHLSVGILIQTIAGVTARVEEDEGKITFTGSHEAYLAEYGLIVTRRISMGADGRSVEGLDRLAGRSAGLRLRRDVPFAVRFHLHPRCRVEAEADGSSMITRPDGTRWRFAAKGAEMSIEPSLHFADPAGTVRTRRIVLRGACWGEADIAWRLEHVA